MNQDRFEQINIGDEAEISHIITAKDVESFVKLTGDNNPLHVDDDYAAKTSFKNRVVHGMLTASFISTIIGTKLPGEGALWYEQQIRFLGPVRIGEKIRVWVKVLHKSYAQRILVLDTVIFGEAERRVIEGQAKVKVLQPEKTTRKENIVSHNSKGAIIITGASRGIGAAIARELANTGHPVVINYRSSETQAEKIANEIRDSKGHAIIYKADVTDQRAVQAMVDKAILEYGNVIGIVNNASPSIDIIDFTELSWDLFQKHIDVQIKGAFYLSQAILPHFLERQHGVIINIASIYVDNVPPIKMIPYNVAKSAMISFSRCLAAECGPKGIRVNCVSPGMTQTDLIANVPEKTKMVAKMQTPMRRIAIPEDIAGTVAFLFSEKAGFITGQNIRVCGGIVMA